MVHTDILRTQPMLRAINSSTESATGTKMNACIFISNRGKNCRMRLEKKRQRRMRKKIKLRFVL